MSDANRQFWTGIPFTGSHTDGSQLLLFDDLCDSNRLSGPSNFDDGRCAQSTANTMGRNGPINCQSHFTIPADTAPGIYSLYWVWDFTKLTAVDPSYLEMYTSCMDVEVVGKNGSPAAPPPGRPTPADPSSSTTRSTQTHHTKTVIGNATTITHTVNPVQTIQGSTLSTVTITV